MKIISHNLIYTTRPSHNHISHTSKPPDQSHPPHQKTNAIMDKPPQFGLLPGCHKCILVENTGRYWCCGGDHTLEQGRLHGIMHPFVPPKLKLKPKTRGSAKASKTKVADKKKPRLVTLPVIIDPLTGDWRKARRSEPTTTFRKMWV